MHRGVRRVVVLAAMGMATAIASAPVGTSAQETRKAAAAPAIKAQAKPKAESVPAADPNDPRMKTLLAAWERQSAKLKTLDVTIDRVDKSPAWGDEEFKGRALLESPNHAWLDFSKVNVDEKGKRTFVPYERIVCTGNEVWQFRPEVKQVFIFPLDKQNKQRALEEGPLPFLFNMKAAEAEARYVMALVNEEKTAYIISVVPRLKVDSEAFSKAFIRLDREQFLPNRILLFSPDGKSTKDFKLVKDKVFPNAPIAAINFVGKDPGPPWQVVRDPIGNDAPAPKSREAVKRQAPGAPPRAAVAPRRAAPAN